MAAGKMGKRGAGVGTRGNPEICATCGAFCVLHIQESGASPGVTGRKGAQQDCMGKCSRSCERPFSPRFPGVVRVRVGGPLGKADRFTLRQKHPDCAEHWVICELCVRQACPNPPFLVQSSSHLQLQLVLQLPPLLLMVRQVATNLHFQQQIQLQ